MLRTVAMRWVTLALWFSSVAVASDIPKGTKVVVKLDETLSSDTAVIGQPFTGHVDRDIRFGTERVFIRKGSLVNGVVKYARSTWNYSQAGELELEVTSIVADGVNYSVMSNTLVRAGQDRPVNPNTGREDDTGARRADITRAGVDVLTGGGGNAPSATIPDTDVSVSGDNIHSGMQVIMPTGMKLTFTIVEAKGTVQKQQ
ncbi:MAG TPA: hypothetical protein VKW78_05550 [Terriglobales bacterium]|nr:hypothetical protein [Terriglobales bacterium]